MKKILILTILVVSLVFTGCWVPGEQNYEVNIPEDTNDGTEGILVDFANITNRGYIPNKIEYELVHFTGENIAESKFLSPTSTEFLLDETLIVGEWYLVARLYDRNGLVATGECVFIVQQNVVTDVELILEVVSGNVSIIISE